jgi:hypothetical protein
MFDDPVMAPLDEIPGTPPLDRVAGDILAPDDRGRIGQELRPAVLV